MPEVWTYLDLSSNKKGQKKALIWSIVILTDGIVIVQS